MKLYIFFHRYPYLYMWIEVDIYYIRQQEEKFVRPSWKVGVREIVKQLFFLSTSANKRFLVSFGYYCMGVKANYAIWEVSMKIRTLVEIIFYKELSVEMIIQLEFDSLVSFILRS